MHPIRALDMHIQIAGAEFRARADNGGDFIPGLVVEQQAGALERIAFDHATGGEGAEERLGCRIGARIVAQRFDGAIAAFDDVDAQRAAFHMLRGHEGMRKGIALGVVIGADAVRQRFHAGEIVGFAFGIAEHGEQLFLGEDAVAGESDFLDRDVQAAGGGGLTRRRGDGKRGRRARRCGRGF